MRFDLSAEEWAALSGGLCIFAQPGIKLLKFKAMDFIKAGYEFPNFRGICRDTDSVDGKECVDGSKRGALVTVNEGVVL